MDDQKVRLIFETLGADGIAALRAQLAGVHSEAPAVATAMTQISATEARAEKDTYDLADAVQKLDNVYEVLGADQRIVSQAAGAGLGPVALAMAELGEQSENAALRVTRVGTASTETNKGIGAARMGILDISRATQDFAQGGLGGVLNNLEGLGRAIPAVLANPIAIFGSLPALLTLGGVAAYSLYQNWDKLAGVFETRRPFPGQASDLEGLERQLKANEKALDGLREKESLNNAEMAQANSLITQQAQLEAEIALAKETRKNEEKFGAEADPAAKDRAEGFARAIQSQGTYREVVERITQSRAMAEGARDQDIPGIRKSTEEALNKALAGDEGMRSAIKFYADQDKLGITGTLSAAITRLSPEKDKWAKNQAEALTKQGEEYEEASRPEIEQLAADRKLGEELTRQGRENEALGVKQARDEEVKDRAEAAKQDKERAKRADKLAGRDDKTTAEQFEASIKGSGIADQAGAMLAQIQEQGGVTDRFGRFRRMGADQQQAYVRGQVEQYLHRPIGTDRFGRTQFANVGMGGEETGLTAQAIVDRGQKEVTRRLSGLAGQQMGNTSRLLAVADSLQNDVIRLQAQMTQQTQGVDGLARKARMSKKSPLSR